VENFLRAKAHYLIQGPLRSRDGLIVWGAGKTGRRLSKHLIRGGWHDGDVLACFEDPKVVGNIQENWYNPGYHIYKDVRRGKMDVR